MKLFNHAGSPIDLFWVDPSSPRNPVRQLDRPLRNSTDTKINSFNTHQFVVRYANHRPGVEAHFTKGLGDETFHVTYNATTNNLQIQLANKFAIWQDKLVLSRRRCHGLHDEDLATCVSKTLSEEIDVLSDSFTSLQKTTTKIAHRLRNYTCDDDTRPTTPPISTYPYTWKNQQYEVQVLLNMTHAKIWLVEDFVTEDGTSTVFTFYLCPPFLHHNNFQNVHCSKKLAVLSCTVQQWLLKTVPRSFLKTVKRSKPPTILTKRRKRRIHSGKEQRKLQQHHLSSFLDLSLVHF